MEVHLLGFHVCAVSRSSWKVFGILLEVNGKKNEKSSKNKWIAMKKQKMCDSASSGTVRSSVSAASISWK